MLSESNLLILDAPTNHLDMKTKDLFQQALLRYGGTLLIVSHDRHFLDNLADRVIEVRGGRVHDYPGNYSWFLEKREEVLNEEVLKKQDEPAPAKKGDGRTAEKTRASGKAGKAGKELAALEAGIAKEEARREEIDALLCLPEVFSDPLRARELAKEREKLEQTLSAAYRRWEELVC